MNQREMLARMVPTNDVWKKLYPTLHRDTQMDYSVKCPFHGDTKPSLRIYVSHNFARCYGGCNRGFDNVALVSLAHVISSAEAIEWIERSFNLDLTPVKRMQELAQRRDSVPSDLDAIYSSALEDYSYLEGRAIPERVQRAYGIRRYGGYVIFPHYKWGILAALTGRACQPGIEPKHQSWQGPFGEPMFGSVDSDSKIIFVCEAQIDALSILTLGLAAVSLKLSSISPENLQTLALYSAVIIATDGDQRGREGAITLQRLIKTMTYDLHCPVGEDMNSLHVKGLLAKFLEHRISILNSLKIR